MYTRTLNKILIIQKKLLFLCLLLITPIISAQNKVNIEIIFERQSDNSIDFFYSKNVLDTNSLRLEFKLLTNSYDKRDSNPKVNTSIKYSLPFINEKDITIMEASYLGETYFQNEKPIDWKSFVVYSKKADTICSMRKGKVIRIINKHKNNSTITKYILVKGIV
ncbi:hypothetical protein [Lacinutrix sp. MEBiC02595]